MKLVKPSKENFSGKGGSVLTLAKTTSFTSSRRKIWQKSCEETASFDCECKKLIDMMINFNVSCQFQRLITSFEVICLISVVFLEFYANFNQV